MMIQAKFEQGTVSQVRNYLVPGDRDSLRAVVMDWCGPQVAPHYIAGVIRDLVVVGHGQLGWIDFRVVSS